ncbi:MAG: hypothetical protein NTX40_03260 [Planctomycetota bacterium]|nr:hypothetical protein [Planctomycetota bacterium]
MANPTNNESLGIFSLRAAASGLVLPILVITFLVAFHADLAGQNRSTIAWLVGTVFITLEVFAVLAGLGAWASAAGKIGTLLALVILVGGLAASAAAFHWPVPLDELTGAKARPAPQPGEPAALPASPSAPRLSKPADESRRSRDESAGTPPPAPEKPVRRGPPGELFPNVPPQK